MSGLVNGHLYIGYDSSHILDCGIVQSISDNVNVAVSQTRIPTYTAENAFTFDISATDPISFTLKRVNPVNAYDPLDHDILSDDVILSANWNLAEAPTGEWCNRLWVQALVMLINRWQANTDGCRLTYLPIVGGEVYQHGYDEINVYLQSLSYTYNTDSPEVLQVSISAIVGSKCSVRQEVV